MEDLALRRGALLGGLSDALGDCGSVEALLPGTRAWSNLGWGARKQVCVTAGSFGIRGPWVDAAHHAHALREGSARVRGRLG